MAWKTLVAFQLEWTWAEWVVGIIIYHSSVIAYHIPAFDRSPVFWNCSNGDWSFSSSQLLLEKLKVYTWCSVCKALVASELQKKKNNPALLRFPWTKWTVFCLYSPERLLQSKASALSAFKWIFVVSVSCVFCLGNTRRNNEDTVEVCLAVNL